jgi:chemotaxis protein CheX
MSDSSLTPYRSADFVASTSMTYLDETVAEVFSMMLGFTTEAMPTEGDPHTGDNGTTAVVGFSGAMRGLCGVRVTTRAAAAIASAMLGGAPMAEDDESLGDAVGELCNMLAGGWKNRIPSLSSRCSLSPPTVISGREYTVHMISPAVVLARTYRFNEEFVYLTLHCEEST